MTGTVTTSLFGESVLQDDAVFLDALESRVSSEQRNVLSRLLQSRCVQTTKDSSAKKRNFCKGDPVNAWKAVGSATAPVVVETVLGCMSWMFAESNVRQICERVKDAVLEVAAPARTPQGTADQISLSCPLESRIVRRRR